MVNFYVIQIRLGKIAVDDVPAKFKDAVESAIQEMMK